MSSPGNNTIGKLQRSQIIKPAFTVLHKLAIKAVAKLIKVEPQEIVEDDAL